MKIYKNTTNYINYSEEFKKYEQPIIKAKICGEEIHMLIDTGATACVISDEFVKRHRLKNNNTNYLTTIVDGTTKTTSGKKARIRIGKFSFDIDMLISKIDVGCNIKIEGILGYDFFQKYNIRIDAMQHILYMDNVE